MHYDNEMELFYLTSRLNFCNIPYKRKGYIFELPIMDIIFKNKNSWKIKFDTFTIISSKSHMIGNFVIRYYNLYQKYKLLLKYGLINDLCKEIIKYIIGVSNLKTY